jgi:hypothetical protein
MSAPRAAVAAAAAAVFAACVAAPPAQAAGSTPVTQGAAVQMRRVCRGPASVFDTPGGIVIGILAPWDQVGVLMHAAGRPGWVLVRGPIGIRGWMRERALCR